MKNLVVNLVNIFKNNIRKAEISITNERIFQITILGDEDVTLPYAMPGFVDAHVHIESSMMTPSQFGKMAVVHGTVGTVSDPHEIANVLGVKGVEYMIENGKTIPFKFCFGAPSCVPATAFETAGAEINAEDIKLLMQNKDIGYLAEMMNYPGVINNDPEILKKISYAKEVNKPVDGHAPGMTWYDATSYFAAGISTDHECFTLKEAEDKLKLGVKILIREGSAAKNFEALIPLAEKFESQIMFCSDDKHPDDLEIGHINLLVKRAIEIGIDRYKVLRIASLNPVMHYDLNIGLLREGEPADFILVNNLKDFKIQATYINGVVVAENGNSLIENIEPAVINNFEVNPIKIDDLHFKFKPDTKTINVIKVNDGQLITDALEINLPEKDKEKHLIETDVLKIVVVNRYLPHQKPAIAFIKGFGLKNGAIGSSVAHDSHNIIAVGTDDDLILDAINLIIRDKGGVSAVSPSKMGNLALPIAGLMSNKDGYEVAKDYAYINNFAKETLCSTLTSPFMSLSFMALLVIPSLKLSDLGLFNGSIFQYSNLEN